MRQKYSAVFGPRKRLFHLKGTVYLEAVQKELLKRIKNINGCWVWQACKMNQGYGTFRISGKGSLAHRHSYEVFKEPINKSMFIDHVCRNRACINPDHLRVVTPKINCLENSKSPCAINKLKTACKNGHLFDEKNTYTYKYGDRVGNRICKKCRAICEIKRKIRKQLV